MSKSPLNHNNNNRIAFLQYDVDLKQIEFSYSGIIKECQNKAKGAKIRGCDSACNQNIKKVFAEGLRVSELLKKVTGSFKTR